MIAPSNVREPAHRAFPKSHGGLGHRRVVEAYADAAERVKAAGLDGLELECYGHLIDQFWSPATNRRDDEYGGALDNRMRFGLEVLARDPRSGSAPTSSSAREWSATRIGSAGCRERRASRSPDAWSPPA